jgi:hypothetical protein
MSVFVCLLFMISADNPVIVQHTDMGSVIGEQQGYAAEIMNGRYTRQTPDNT